MFQSLIGELNRTTDQEARSNLLEQAQRIIAEDYVNGYLFQLAFPTVAKKDIVGLWENAPAAVTDLSAIRWQ